MEHLFNTSIHTRKHTNAHISQENEIVKEKYNLSSKRSFSAFLSDRLG